ncbi:Uncharacterised protein [Mycobacteroides abscessus subsp. abscessus]|nr:Uncharacterised protein [Mycobacteroides abscessus subsp. abscessus]SHV68877.1 Uncharacterised protein [Mycobacteroides abscessus subsp. abscessus]SHW14582.1 Uncharacterised protein [Mycobacteroides abscessus subsp. abscessus]SHW25360.1 Uncharacterised protein [Mycobacteroides abscessus subsp. abscessus]SHX70023.1 Uncharacterised protein [Mycobacteroides abscessus subsp. abscessus]
MSSIGVVEAAVDAFCAESIEDLTAGEALAVLARLEVVRRRLASRGLGLISAVTGPGLADAAGRHVVCRGVVAALAYG